MISEEYKRLIAEALDKQGILTPKVFAYALATIDTETGGKGPVREGNAEDNAGSIAAVTQLYNDGIITKNYALPDENGNSFYGRGFVQLTHKNNYKAMGDILGIDLANNPDLALNPQNAANILALFFKERGVAESAEAGNFYAARSGINGTDRATETANSADRYLNESNEYVKSFASKKISNNFPMKFEPQNLDIGSNNSKNDYFNQKLNEFNFVKKAKATGEVNLPEKGNYGLKDNNPSKYISPNQPRPYVGKNQGNYQIKTGDTLSGLAQQFGTTVSNFMRQNPQIKDRNMIRAGANLSVPSAPSATNNSSGYRIRSGDTLTSIARDLGTTVNDLVRKNGIADANKINAGDTLKIK